MSCLHKDSFCWLLWVCGLNQGLEDVADDAGNVGGLDAAHSLAVADGGVSSYTHLHVVPDVGGWQVAVYDEGG